MELNVGSGKKCSSCGGTVAAGRKTCQNCGHSFASLGDRVDAVEDAVLALAALEFGALFGHPFHGNQYTGGGPSAPTDKGGFISRVDAAEKMYGCGSREHQAAINRWGPTPDVRVFDPTKKHALDKADREQRHRAMLDDMPGLMSSTVGSGA